MQVDYLKYENYFKQIDNIYFNNSSNKKNLSFVLTMAKILKLNLKNVIRTVNRFKGLNYRQQIIFKSKKLIIINDSKSTSFSATLPLLEKYKSPLPLLLKIDVLKSLS